MFLILISQNFFFPVFEKEGAQLYSMPETS